MAQWKVEPTWKKSVIERNYMHKGDNTIIVEIGWRWGEFIVYTEDDNPPDIEAGVDIFNCGYESEMVETFDGCWDDIEYDNVDDDTLEWLEEFLEDNSYYDLEEHGWEYGDCEMIIDCDLEITRINEDGTDGESITTGEDEDIDTTKGTVNETTQLVPGAAWPFSNATVKEEQYAQFKCESCDFSTDDIEELVDNPNDDDKGAFVCPKCGGKVDLS